ncbi:transcription termination factor 1, mitochondrial isoform X2 [Chelonia mydas]|uniref:Transcription termination factor n=2 Tax=Chelonia mydas TaxID=8469 RepID=M7BI28_CHEMY|nr:transcription termination factor 1, mitochondrial isoform X2 [Chelonia mydas]XP_027678515.1 transcription termination factor 1, mitochondrial isoform X2 [Chelonia mydas]XP_027678516.1 transcription termination factor 1, mitochondrial isoform X2 [Chelonia mydas]XP_037746654.1 transcription termination factor 1, mitochondrial isoform X2 [Chelonia mydas]XP_043397155.1 transcription termination factor 1, mitochondrial isoform X2 [Chelonia mydas]XP_043397156.1 transcription termination factor 1,
MINSGHTILQRYLQQLIPMAARGLLRMKNSHLHNMNCFWLIRFSAEIALRPVSSRHFCLKIESADAESCQENGILVNNLACMGVDVKMARRRQPGVLKKLITNEEGLKKFLQSKGATNEIIASIISRYPRAITRSHESLEKRWELWRSILMTDLEIVNILGRSPESFFRSSNNMNMEKNITFFCSLGLTSKHLSNMLTRAPRAFSNRVELNKQMTDLLHEICLSLGGENPNGFVKHIISKNVFILLRSSKQVSANIEFLQSSFHLRNEELLALLHGTGADILDLSNEYIKKNFTNAKEKLLSLGCTEREVDRFFIRYPRVLFLSAKTLSDKIDCLLQAKIHIKQIAETSRVLDVSISTVRSRVKELEKTSYDFKTYGIGILTLSKKRFEAKLEKLHSAW